MLQVLVEMEYTSVILCSLLPPCGTKKTVATVAKQNWKRLPALSQTEKYGKKYLSNSTF